MQKALVGNLMRIRHCGCIFESVQFISQLLLERDKLCFLFLIDIAIFGALLQFAIPSNNLIGVGRWQHAYERNTQNSLPSTRILGQ